MDLDKLLEQSIKNLEEDRNLSKDGIDKINTYCDTNNLIDAESFSKIMISYSKIVENLQKSNEQIINIVGIKTKEKTKPESSVLTEEEKKLIMRD